MNTLFRPFPFTAFEINGLRRVCLERACAYARRFNIQAIGYMGAEWQEFQMLDHTPWGVPPVNDEARRFMENYQQTIREASEYITAQGLEFYLWRRELRLPKGFVQKYGVDWLSFDNPELWELVRWNLKAHAQLFPKLRGMFLTCTGEQTPNEWITPNGIGGDVPLWQRFERMFRTVQEACDQCGWRIVFRNHGAGEDAVPLVMDESTYMGHFLKAARNMGDRFTMMGKATEHDWQPTSSFNAILAHMAAARPTYMELSLPMEYNAVSRTPFPLVEDTKYRLLKAQEIGCVGAVARIDWHMCGHQTERTFSSLGNTNELSAYTFGRLVNEIGTPVEEIYADFAKEFFGERAGTIMVPILKNLPEAGCKTYYELGAKGCLTPSGAPMHPEWLIPSLRNDHLYRWSLSAVDYANFLRAFTPSQRYLQRIENEKNEAMAIYRDALRQIRNNLPLFAKDKAAMLIGQLERVSAEAAIRRDYMVAFAAWMAYDRSGDASFGSIAADKLKALAPNVSAFCATYDPLDRDPLVELLFAFGSNARNSMDKLAARLEESRAFWKDNVAFVRPTRYSRHINNAVEIPLTNGRLTLDPNNGQIVEFTAFDQVNILDRPATLISMRLGGLIEEGKHIGRTYLRSRTLGCPDGSPQTKMEFAYSSIQITWRQLAKLNGVCVDVCFKDLACPGILQLPWLRTLGVEPLRLSCADVQAFSDRAESLAPLGEGWKCVSSSGQTLFMIDTTHQGRPGGLPDGLSWKVGTEGSVSCLLFSEART